MIKTRILALVLTCVFLISCKEGFENPFIPEIEKKANIILDGELQRTYTSYNSPQFEGYVKNIGDGTGYNCKVAITCYSDVGQTTIIDIANGFPANLGEIPSGKRAYFDAIAFEVNSHDDIKSYSIKITWLDRDFI